MRRLLLPACLLLLGVLVFSALRAGRTPPAEERAPGAEGAAARSLETPRLYVAPSRIEVEADARRAAGHAAGQPPEPAHATPSDEWAALLGGLREADRTRAQEAWLRWKQSGEWATLDGVLREADSTPAKNAWIRWVPVLPDGTRLGSEQVKADAEGRFTLRARVAMRVHLEGDSQVSIPTAFDLAWPADGGLGSLTLLPGCALVGQIVAPGEWPRIGSWGVTVTPLAQALQDASLPESPIPTNASGAAPARPLEGGYASADENGRWQVQGLRPGTYRVEVGTATASNITQEGVLFYEQAPFHAALKEACVRVVQVPGPEIRISLAVSVTHVQIDRGEHLAERAASAMVSATDAEGRCTECTGWYNAHWSDEVDNSSLALAAGCSYRLRIWANGFEPLELDHVAGAAGEVVVVPVRLRPVPRGTLTLRASEQRSKGSTDLSVELRDRVNHERVHWEHVTLEGSKPVLLTLPSGAWTLVITPWASAAASDTRFDLPLVQPLVLSAGEETTLTWSPPQGGRFELRAECRDAVRRPFSVQVERLGATARPTIVGWDPERGAMRWSDDLETATTFRGQDVYPAGEITLRVDAAACMPQRVPVRIVSGEVTPVLVTLEPR